MEVLVVLDHRVGQDPLVRLDFKVPPVDQVDSDFLELKETLVLLEAQDLEVSSNVEQRSKISISISG